MNKQEAIELLATFLFQNNLNRSINQLHLADEIIERINTPEMKVFFVGEATKFYEFLDDNGLIVKP
jgi:UDP-N-acetyl-D-mannosaminuronic acid transferase (WecB/TagA/CpsF family)